MTDSTLGSTLINDTFSDIFGTTMDIAMNVTTNTTSPCGNCSGRGSCLGTYCACRGGFYGKTCESSLTDLYGGGWTAIRSILAIGYFTLSIMWAVSVYRYFFLRRKDNGFVSQNALAVSICYCTYDLVAGLVNSIAPYGELTKPWIYSLWVSFAIMFGFFFLGLILSFWIETFHAFQQHANKVQQLQKIKRDYDPEISLQDLAQTLNKMNRFRLPFIIALIIMGLFQVSCIATSIARSPVYGNLQVGNLCANIVLYFVYCIAFMVYERKLSSLVDSLDAKREIRLISIKVRFFCIVSLCSITVYTIWGYVFFGPISAVVYKCVTIVQQWIVTVVIWSIYVKVDWKKLTILHIVYVPDSKDDSQTADASQTDANPVTEIDIE